MTSDGLKSAGPGMRRRVGDQVEFLAGLQRRFYSDTKRFFREELGARNLLIASNWVTADPARLEALEHYRLVYSSDSSVAQPNGSMVPEVKIFEYIE